jgi:hypothetical protein
MLDKASATPAMASAKPMRSSVSGTTHTMSAATIPANAITNGMYSPVMFHTAEPITTPMARARAPDAMKGARRGSGSARTESVSQMSNRWSPSNEQPGKPGWMEEKPPLRGR